MSTSREKRKYIRVTMPDRSHFTSSVEMFDVTMLDGMSEGEKATIQWVGMTDEEYENLPEYEG